jgi:hypothetical protein
MSLIFQNIDPPIPLSALRVCPPPTTKAGVHTRPAERWMGGQYFETREIGLATYSNNLSTSKEENSEDFCLDFVQEFHLRLVRVGVYAHPFSLSML